jgi:hypothetical protein
VIQHHFTFESPLKADNFKTRLCLMLDEFAVYRIDHEVWIIDARETPQTERILQMAKSSSATWARWTEDAEQVSSRRSTRFIQTTARPVSTQGDTGVFPAVRADILQ